MATLALVLAAVAIIAALAYWELVLAEGAHLGPRVVALLYDWVARRYDGIKQFDPAFEEWFIGEPLALALSQWYAPLVLDVATGTGRLPRTLLAQPGFSGHIIGLDSSRAMLARAAPNAVDRLTLVWQSATRLPFDADAFDAVTCMEALEFMPDTRKALGEIIRVLRPGGLVLLTNRVGFWARFLPGHTQSPTAFEALLRSMGLEQIQTRTWQVEYNLVWAIKPGRATWQKARSSTDILRCPDCNGPLARVDHSMVCNACGRVSRIASDGVIELMRGVGANVSSV
jgi:ubiquinone/menaquinone biosynthesis C-methylase UbiE